MCLKVLNLNQLTSLKTQCGLGGGGDMNYNGCITMSNTDIKSHKTTVV